MWVCEWVWHAGRRATLGGAARRLAAAPPRRAASPPVPLLQNDAAALLRSGVVSPGTAQLMFLDAYHDAASIAQVPGSLSAAAPRSQPHRPTAPPPQRPNAPTPHRLAARHVVLAAHRAWQTRRGQDDKLKVMMESRGAAADVVEDATQESQAVLRQTRERQEAARQACCVHAACGASAAALLPGWVGCEASRCWCPRRNARPDSRPPLSLQVRKFYDSRRLKSVLLLLVPLEQPDPLCEDPDDGPLEHYCMLDSGLRRILESVVRRSFHRRCSRLPVLSKKLREMYVPHTRSVRPSAPGSPALSRT